MNAIAPEGDKLYIFSDNTKYRAIWDTWMRDISLSTTDEHLRGVVRSMHNFANKNNGAKCLSCRHHAEDYMIENPPEDYIGSKQQLFAYVATFMNVVQKRKSIERNDPSIKLYNLDILWKMYNDSPNGQCSIDCSDNKPNIIAPPSVTRPIIVQPHLYNNHRKTGRIVMRNTNFM